MNSIIIYHVLSIILLRFIFLRQRQVEARQHSYQDNYLHCHSLSICIIAKKRTKYRYSKRQVEQRFIDLQFHLIPASIYQNISQIHSKWKSDRYENQVSFWIFDKSGKHSESCHYTKMCLNMRQQFLKGRNGNNKYDRQIFILLPVDYP